MIRGPLAVLVALGLAFVLTTYAFGLAIGSTVGIVMFIAVTLLIKRFTSWLDMFKFPSKKQAGYVGGGLFALTVFMYGFFGAPALVPFTWESLLGGVGGGATILTGPMAAGEAQGTITECRAGISDELIDDTASVILNAYDLEASGGKSSAVDLTTNCWFYSNGNGPSNFIAASTDTSAKTESGYWGIGDTVFIYCGGTSYYSEPVEGQCISGAAATVEIESHAIVTATTGLVIAGYDKNKNALTAAGNSSTADYDLTLGASQTEKIYLEMTQNTADVSYNLMALAMDTWNDISKIKPAGDDIGKFTKVPTPDYLDSVTVSSDESGGATANITLSYEVYKLNTPVLMRNWDSVMYGFEVTAGSTDPTASDTDFDGFDGAVVCFLDGTYVRGVDGNIYYDIHSHAEAGSEADVGLTNLITYPVQKDDCVVIEGA